MKKGAFKVEPKMKIVMPNTKIAKDYGKRKPDKYSTQAHDGLVIPQVKNHMKFKEPKMKQNDIFDTNGDGKASKFNPEKKEERPKPGKNATKGRFVYSYKKRI